MNTMLLAAYLAVASYFAWDAFRHGVWDQQPERLFRARHHVLLTLVALLSGLLWVLAVPALLGRVAHTKAAGNRDQRRPRSWGSIRQAHARS